MQFTKTLSFSISLLLITLVTFLVALLFYNNWYAMSVVRNQVVQSYRDLLPRYVEKQDDSLSEIQNYLIRTLNHTAENEDIRHFNSYPINSDDYYLAASNLFLQLSRDINSYGYADILFVYSQNNNSLVSFSSNKARQIQSIDRNLLDSVRVASSTFLSSRWQVTRLGGVPGLLCMSTDGAGSFMGAWVDMTNLLSEMPNPEMDETRRGMILLSGDRGTYVGTRNLHNLNRMVEIARVFFDGTPQSVTEPGNTLGYLLIVEKSKKADLYFIEAIEERSLMSNLPYFQIMIYLLPIVMLIVFLIYFTFLQRIIVMPIHTLTRGMQALSEGNLRLALPESGAGEIRYVIRSFNEMVRQIESLRIDVYEKQLEAHQADLASKQAELRSMQLQINPHFFANSLNIIYSLSAIRDYSTIQKMALLLSRYFRYIMHAGHGTTELQSELSFVRDYLDIQKLRFTKRLTWELRADSSLDRALLPPLTVQPFVENAIVHGFSDPINGLHIIISIEPIVSSKSHYQIRIEDNGCGFSESQLETFAQPDFILHGASKHIGIWNVMSRVFMTFGEEASIDFSNRVTGGASIVIKLPVHTMMESSKPTPLNPFLPPISHFSKMIQNEDQNAQ